MCLHWACRVVLWAVLSALIKSCVCQLAGVCLHVHSWSPLLCIWMAGRAMTMLSMLRLRDASLQCKWKPTSSVGRGDRRPLSPDYGFLNRHHFSFPLLSTEQRAPSIISEQLHEKRYLALCFVFLPINLRLPISFFSLHSLLLMTTATISIRYVTPPCEASVIGLITWHSVTTGSLGGLELLPLLFILVAVAKLAVWPCRHSCTGRVCSIIISHEDWMISFWRLC